MVSPNTLKSEYWESFEVNKGDIEFLYNRLLEVETPQTPKELITAVINNRIKQIQIAQEKEKQKRGVVYYPKDSYQVGQTLVFPALEWKSGQVNVIRKGFNPEHEGFDVIEVTLEGGNKTFFASNLPDHLLNTFKNQSDADPLLNIEHVVNTYGSSMLQTLEKNLEKNLELVRIAGCWFPKALLVDINSGHLNLCEAVLEEARGGPLTTKQLLDQIELQSSTNLQLTEFSLNYALQDDSRFDEVGPAGETLWYLKDMEADDVRKPPLFLQYEKTPYDQEAVKPFLAQFEGDLFDELEEWEKTSTNSFEIKVSLIFPHWRSGTLPLSYSLTKFFPTAYEAPRVRFTFVDGNNKKRFPGWVVRPHKYVYGLKDWYEANGLMPGSLVHLKKGDQPGEIKVFSEKCRQSREWMRTALIGVDQGVVFGLLKQNISTTYNERMSIAVPDPEAFEEIWKKNDSRKEEINHLIIKIMRELAKLNPQIHAQELYAAVNMVRRCPPGVVLNCLINSKEVKPLGDLYFRFSDGSGEG